MNISSNHARKVFFYSPGEIAPGGSGSALRQFSNLRAYLDLGFDVEVFQFFQRGAKTPAKLNAPIQWSQFEYTPRPPSLLKRFAFYAGVPRRAILETIFPARPFVANILRANAAREPNAIHHFEYIDVASAALDASDIKSVWSCHDIFSRRIPLLWEMRAEGEEKETRYRRARVQNLRRAEDWVARSNNLILNIAIHEQQEFQQRGYQHAEFFPMSWANESPAPRRRAWMSGGILRLLHLGSVDGFLGYDSLRFILEKVFPLLPANFLQRVELQVAGKIGESDFARKIRQLAEPYPQVKFLGFVDDVKALYSGCDLQVVGGVRATGMRTRIIESFVYGVPVLSTTESARGVAHLTPNENILLADEPPAFAAELQALTPQKLDSLARAARQTYDQFYARPVAAAKLAELLEKYIR
ncbi:MAG: hypothetical protein Fur002_05330 [Anaerolineales bacterium]